MTKASRSATTSSQSKPTKQRDGVVMVDGVPHRRVSAGFRRQLITRGPNKGSNSVEMLYRLVPILPTVTPT